MRIEELDFRLPPRLIAQRPSRPRNAGRLMVVGPGWEEPQHRRFQDLSGLLRSGDLLVLNDSRVIAARVKGRKDTGGRVEILFLRPAQGAPDTGENPGECWEVLLRPARRMRAGTRVTLGGDVGCELLQNLGSGRFMLRLPSGESVRRVTDEHGEMPLPPYIKAPLKSGNDYQTVYADQWGSAAAPTAGLHFTRDMLQQLEAAGIEIARVTLHVGMDTFRPVAEPIVEEHQIHQEVYSIPPDSLASIDSARREGRRVVAVGTTTTRVLETVYAGAQSGAGATAPATGWSELFITPGYQFCVVNAMITNFHLPRSSLLAMVMAFAGVDRMRHAYRVAVEKEYRFFSFGDAMLLYPADAGISR